MRHTHQMIIPVIMYLMTAAMPGWCDGLLIPSSRKGQSTHVSLNDLKVMRSKIRTGMSPDEMEKGLGEADYCIGELIECRYGSSVDCSTGGMQGFFTLVIWFENSKVTKKNIFCVAE